MQLWWTVADINYPLAAISEASLEFVLADVGQAAWDEFFDAHIKESAEFTEWTPVLKFTAEIGDPADPSSSSTASTETVGYAARAADRHEEIHVREDRLILFRRGQYTDWHAFTGWVLPWLERLRTSCPHLELTAIVAAYINELPVPDEPYEVSDWVRIAPPIPPSLSQTILSMRAATTIPIDDGRAEIFVRTEESDERLYPGLTLRIRTELDRSLAFESVNFDAEVEDWLTALRDAKNAVFEACITEATRMKMRGPDDHR